MQEIKPLLVFAAVLEHGSMNAAAQALNMTASAVSQHISRLESQHGVKLLHRSTRRLTPTDAGVVLGQYCRTLSHTLHDAQHALDTLKTEAAGDLTIALTSGMAQCALFHRALRDLREQYPLIRPVLRVSDALLDLQQGGVDIAIRGGEHSLDDESLIARHLATWRWCVCAAPAYLQQHETIVQPEQLAQHAWLSFGNFQLTLQREQHHFALRDLNAWHCDSIAAVRVLSEQGFGLSLQLDGEIQQELHEKRLAIVLPEWQMPAVNIYAVTPYRVQTAKTEAMLRLLQQHFQSASK
ncbi:MAG: LysR family transcriptional regulator [Neisseria sp.]|nr:LysR family transcriptional regulator [Neisseria sp.]